MKTVTLAPAIAGALALATCASAQSPNRFNVHSIISEDGSVVAAVVNGGNALGTLEADVDSGAIGTVETTTLSTGFSFNVTSTTNLLVPGLLGETMGSGRYTIDGTQPIVVDWNWGSVTGSGSWKILGSTGATVASLSFANGSYTSTGGSFGTASAGSASVSLAAGTYTFWSDFKNGGNANSSVTFTFGAVPAPGAIVLLGAAGLVGTRRRR